MEGIKVEKRLSLSTSVKVLFEKIVSSDFADKFRGTKLDVSLLINLKTRLLRLLIALNDAEEKPITNPTVKEWFYMLRYVVFEVANFIDEINQVLNDSSSHFKRFDVLINSIMIKLLERLEFLSSRGEQKGVSNSFWNGSPPTNSVVVNESSIYGRDSDVEKLKNLLLLEDATDGDSSKTGIISIVGMGGIGKTTLAKLLYNDRKVEEKFRVRGWAHISKDFVISRVLETILESITSQTEISDGNLNSQLLQCLNEKRKDETSDVYSNLLVLTVQQILRTHVFLLVLDDVWDAKSVNWIYLMDILNVGETESRIIITTRDERVALSMQTFLSVHYLRPLESNDCWSLLARHAFGAWNNHQRSDLEEIGKEIAKKCDGLPLAAIALGAFLRINFSPDYWFNVLKSDILELMDYDVKHALQLSYHYLPAPLKQCFGYCSIFPKKSILEKNVVVQLWIAVGLVDTSADQEKVKEEYFDELVSRSLIHRRSIGDEEANFEMHSLIHDLATTVSSPYSIRLDEHNPSEMVRNLSYNRGLFDSFNKFDKLYGVKDLRTFLALPLQQKLPFCLLSNKVVHDLLPTMKELRVLSLSNYKSITEVPNSIGNLSDLRYLNLSHTKIERLPSETCKLYNLQFLLLSGCKRLTELPEDMGKLVHLCHLDVSDTTLREMPAQIAKLENLQTLSDFVVSKHDGGLKVAELGNFPHLQGKLSISELQNVNDPFEAFQANMKMKERIDELALEWDCGSTFTDSQIQIQSVVLEDLRPSTNLKSLTIKGYGGICFPNWLSDTLFINLVYLKISNCDDCLWLPPLGQLGNLKELIIEGMHSVQIIGPEFYASDCSPSFQPFPSLETLHFENMQEWEEWNLIGGTTNEFPSLKTLLLTIAIIRSWIQETNGPSKFS
ncbi:putative disease resistance RPP13-like protein 1 isoform X2 [Medicago truncatula]|uniref:putative disease resistance RPP13-like protein 1 isoform X2 n=1 Tax=Medicago truncatula TaxID=3880 RepID=UPI001968151B|nr:putative disease resistance RPP13-like protein 1 isoform X2 [Medicago truncatula]